MGTETAGKRERFDKCAEILFWAALLMELLLYTLKKFDVTFSYQTYILRGISVMLFGKMILTKYTVKEWVMMLTVLVLGVIGYFVSGRGIDVLLRASIFIFAARGMDVRKIFLAVFVSVAIVFFGWGMQSVLGKRPLYMRMNFGRGENERRFCFGYSHPNTFHYMLWFLISIAIYLWHDRIKWYGYLILFTGNIVVTVLTRSRTGGFLLAVTIALFFLAGWAQKKEKRLCKAPYIGALLIMISCVIISAATIIFGYKTNMLRYVNVLLNNRLEMARGAVFGYDWTLHVTAFSVPENETLIDMGLIRITYTFGWVPTLLFAGCVLYLLFHAYRTRNMWNLVLLLMTFCYTTLEAVQVNSGILYNFVILMTAGYWSQYCRILPDGRNRRCRSVSSDN